MENKNRTGKKYIVLILGLLTAIGPFSIDMYLPAFPDIAKGLNTSVSNVVLSLSSFFIGISAGQLIYGPLLERYGRKKPMYVGMGIYLVSSLGCALAPSIDMLILFRLFQALGGCAGMVAARAIVRDLFESKENARIFSTLMLVVAVSPILAPTTGGYVTAVLGWRYVFVALMIVGLIILAGLYFFLPESKKPDPAFSLLPNAILKNFRDVLKEPQFYTYALTGAISSAGLYAYISGSPFVFMEIFGLNEKQYGWIFALVAIGIISASQFNNLALKNNSSEQIIRVATISQMSIGLMLVILPLVGWAPFPIVTLLIFCFLFCQGFIFPNASALSLARFGHNAGSASALMGATQMGIGACTSGLVGVFHNHTMMPMAGMMAFCALSATTVFYQGRKIILKKASLEKTEEEDVELVSTL